MKHMVFIVIMSILYSCTPSNKSPEGGQRKRIPVITLKEEQIALNTEYPTRIEGKVNVDIRPQVEGYIKKIFVEEGAFVKAGQPLFKIDDRSFVEQMNTAKANLNSAKATLKNAKLEVDKYTLLSDNKVTSDFQLRSATTQYEIAQANVAQQKAALENAKINLEFSLVKSPISGFIGRIPKRIGNLVSKTDTQPLTTLSDISEVYAYFSMTEKDFLQFNTQYSGKNLADKISKVSQVSLTLADGNTYPYHGKIQMINGEFDKNTGSISIRAVFKNPQDLLRTGNTGRIIFPRLVKRVLRVPVLSTLDIQDKIFVLRLDKDNKAQRVAINISDKQGDYYIVKSGLKQGDRILSQQLETVVEGEQIQPLK